MISLVTACMNRDGHLRQTLPQWLALPGIAEVVIVDWSNRTPLRDLRMVDPRVRVIRAEGEARWILSYAYNLGLSQTRHDTILKCDADCVPTAEVTSLLPTEKAFYAGYWKTGAACGKPSVNGQCLFSRKQFEQVNGYSEVIRMYGRDDEDFYDRLIKAGYGRREIPSSELSFMEHTQQERLVNQVGTKAADPVETFLQRQTVYFEMYNLALSKLLPWGIWNARARFEITEDVGNAQVCVRDRTREIPISAPVQSMARLHGLRSVTAQISGLPAQRVMGMDETACIDVLRHKLTPFCSAQRERIPA